MCGLQSSRVANALPFISRFDINDRWTRLNCEGCYTLYLAHMTVLRWYSDADADADAAAAAAPGHIYSSEDTDTGGKSTTSMWVSVFLTCCLEHEHILRERGNIGLCRRGGARSKERGGIKIKSMGTGWSTGGVFSRAWPPRCRTLHWSELHRCAIRKSSSKKPKSPSSCTNAAL